MAVVSGARVDLSWTAATDDVRVAGYRLYRGNAELATISETTYTDTTVVPGTSYAYHVVAYDGSGKTSPPSNTANATTPPADRTLTFTPTDDLTTGWPLVIEAAPRRGRRRR